MIDAKDLVAYSKKLNVLYVEDDESLREETRMLLSNFFTKMDTAEDGKQGLTFFENRHYDIVITDIRMPIMDGIEMTEKILEINPEQPIIITSAHDETIYLLQLVNMGVSSFVLKPLDLQKLIDVLYKVSKSISNENLIVSYRDRLEDSNAALIEENKKLEKALRIFDAKLAKENVQQNAQRVNKNILKKTKTNQIEKLEGSLTEDGLQRFDDYVLDNDLQELTELENEIDSLTVIMILNEQVDDEKMQLLSTSLGRYGQILSNYPIFHNLASSMVSLADTLKGKTAAELTLTKDAFVLMESFIFVLLKWKKEIFETGIINPNMYDASMISDMQTIVLMVNPPEEDEGDMEFF